MEVHRSSWNGPPHRELVGSVSERWKRGSQENQTLHFVDGIMQDDRHSQRGDFFVGGRKVVGNRVVLSDVG